MRIKTYAISKIINVNPELLFETVSTFENYKDWNTIIPNANGKLKKGEKLLLVLKMNGKTRLFNPTVISLEKNKRFVLSKKIISKTIGELTHEFEFKKIENNRTEFIQTWEGKGILVLFMWSKIKNGFSEFEKLNDNLNTYIEKRNTNCIDH